MFTGPQAIALELPCSVKATALAVSPVHDAPPTAFRLTCTNASLGNILSGVRLGFPACRLLAESPGAGAWAPSQRALATRFWALHSARARAPPVQIAAVV